MHDFAGDYFLALCFAMSDNRYTIAILLTVFGYVTGKKRFVNAAKLKTCNALI